VWGGGACVGVEREREARGGARNAAARAETKRLLPIILYYIYTHYSLVRSSVVSTKKNTKIPKKIQRVWVFAGGECV